MSVISRLPPGEKPSLTSFGTAASIARSRLNPQSPRGQGPAGRPTENQRFRKLGRGFTRPSGRNPSTSTSSANLHDTEYNLILLVVRPLINAASFPRMWLIPDPRPLSARQTSPPLFNMTKTHRLRKSSPVRQDDVETLHPA
jgi:hypothetical protein